LSGSAPYTYELDRHDHALHPVRDGVLEHALRPEHVHLVAHARVGAEVADERHVDERVGALRAEHVLELPLAEVDDVHVDVGRARGPRGLVDPDHLEAVADADGEQAAQSPGDAGDQELLPRHRAAARAREGRALRRLG
jgi:hypothetical protein